MDKNEYITTTVHGVDYESFHDQSIKWLDLTDLDRAILKFKYSRRFVYNNKGLLQKMKCMVTQLVNHAREDGGDRLNMRLLFLRIVSYVDPSDSL